MKLDIQESLIKAFKASLKELRYELSDEELYLDIPSDTKFGEFSSNAALKLSRSLKKPPQEIADLLILKLKAHIENTPLKDHIRDIKVEGPGFINFYFSSVYFYEVLKGIISKGIEFFKRPGGKNKRVLIEFVSANPTGPLSVAHARQAAVGDALANIINFMGFEVKKEYYLNDEGNQINILGASVELRIKELGGEKIEFPEDHYQGEYIYDIAREITKHKSQITNIADFAADYILKIIKKELEDFGVKFDCWYSQKELAQSGKIEKTLAALKKKSYLYDLDGAVWFKSTKLGDDKDRVVIKSDKTYTYLTPDIAYHQEKYKRGFDWLINLWGPDHHGYINRIKAAVKACGHNPDSLTIIIVQLATIFKEGKPVQMSTRRGQYITLREVLDEVGLDAARYFFLMRKTSSHLDFDLDVAKKQTQENPVYYVQYAHARICSILKSANNKINSQDLSLALLIEKEELELIKKLCQFRELLNICLTTQDPYMMTVYLGQVAEDFHKFYDLHRVLGVDEKLTQSRLALLEACRIVIATGLGILGVSSPEKM